MSSRPKRSEVERSAFLRLESEQMLKLPATNFRLTTLAGHTLPFPMRSFFTLLLLATSSCAIAQPPQKPIEIKVVVINMFEVGADTGDTPGEYQYWVEREHLDTVLTFPAGYHDLRLNPKTGEVRTVSRCSRSTQYWYSPGV